MKQLITIVAASLLLMLASLSLATSAQAVPANFYCNGTFDGGTYRNVVIHGGATCVITNATISGNVRTLGAPKVVSITNTDIDRNVHVRNVTGSVTIGAAGCRVDPKVGNNLIVRNSKNVAVCEMWIGNNLVLSNNTGRLMARDSTACNNIRVVRNHVLGLRVLRNGYRGNFTVARNTVANKKIVWGNTELEVAPRQCRNL